MNRQPESYRITDTYENTTVLEGTAAAIYGYYPSEEWQIGLYKSTTVFNKEIFLSLYAITINDESGERIDKIWMSVQPEIKGLYFSNLQILDSNLENGKISVVGGYRINSEQDRYRHISFVLDSMFGE